ncbi:hypothetical protein RR42_m2654 [Cupriavidus basilensis]|uniref:Uncharacterized protein n=1 Tax=Cupriavidus basilensis TaxID=68895 RepID=A0A0C4YD46_9BURK|nr:hypothetical protein RR42_m2654 [Cupriavidus basilensis]
MIGHGKSLHFTQLPGGLEPPVEIRSRRALCRERQPQAGSQSPGMADETAATPLRRLSCRPSSRTKPRQAGVLSKRLADGAA